LTCIPEPLSNAIGLGIIVAAGLSGIKKRIETDDPKIEDHVDADIFKMSDAEREKHKIRQLPASLREAIEELKSDSDFLKPVFGKHVIERIVEDAAKQHMELAVRPHPHEFTMYADV